jgi:hypothetical protein
LAQGRFEPRPAGYRVPFEMAVSDRLTGRHASRPGDDEDTSTTSDLPGGDQTRQGGWARRAAVACLAAFVVVGAFGVFGQRTSITSAERNGYRLTVTYPSVVRPGLDVRFNVTVEHAGALGKSVTLAFSRRYFDLFDFQGIRPDPEAATSNISQIQWTWQAMASDTLVVDLDMIAEGGEHFGKEGLTSLIVGGRPVVTVRYHTRWVP